MKTDGIDVVENEASSKLVEEEKKKRQQAAFTAGKMTASAREKCLVLQNVRLKRKRNCATSHGHYM